MPKFWMAKNVKCQKPTSISPTEHFMTKCFMCAGPVSLSTTKRIGRLRFCAISCTTDIADFVRSTLLSPAISPFGWSALSDDSKLVETFDCASFVGSSFNSIKALLMKMQVVDSLANLFDMNLILQ